MRFILCATTLLAVTALGFARPAAAGPITVANAGFETMASGTAPDGLCYSGGPANCATLAGWTNTNGYSFVSSTTNLGNGYYGDIHLIDIGTDPAGGNFIAADGDSVTTPLGTLSQTLTGLTAGESYTVSFWQAAAEQTEHSGAVSETWRVGLGSQFISAPVMSYNGGDFVNWAQVSLSFIATGSSETLSFESIGAPANSGPPFALLDGVSVVEVPEPGAFMLLGIGAFGLAVLRRGRTHHTA
jgi:hypothetical protein